MRDVSRGPTPAEHDASPLGQQPRQILRFADEETALFYLTHPLVGFYHRLRDGRLGAYRVWHDRLQVRPAQLINARFSLFERLGLVSYPRQQQPHSVLVQPINDFTVYLPPTRLE